jgi:hypothetical protein
MINLSQEIKTPFDDGKKKLILEFFIRHFIEMARKSRWLAHLTLSSSLTGRK